ncbi:MAG: 4'-phosphopantetheinyl transferase superfamily protein [Chitinophagaceae bacterium]|nr:MAG: 4'-phosphopantetheinyl transferase superfamily protein [Chitinophagaceae bacterium]
MTETVTVSCSVLPSLTWQAPAFNDRLEKTAHVWKASSSGLAAEQFLPLLQPEEKKKTLQFSRPEAREQFVFARGVLRILLSRYLSLHPQQLFFSKGTNGKPYCTTPAAQSIGFNLSHSGDKLLVAICGSETGVDLEKIKPSFRFDDIAATVFSPEESSFIENADDPHLAFYQLWTRKEALLKATSIGLIDALTEVSCLPGANKVAAATINSYNNWQVQSFPVDENSIGSVATSPGIAVEFFDYDLLHAPIL